LSGLSGLVKVLGVRTIRVTRVVKGIYITALEEDEVLQGCERLQGGKHPERQARVGTHAH
jgi:hypothetical protein